MKLNVKQVDGLEILTQAFDESTDTLRDVVNQANNDDNDENNHKVEAVYRLVDMTDWATNGLTLNGISMIDFTPPGQLKTMLRGVAPLNMTNAFTGQAIVENPITCDVIGGDLTNAFANTSLETFVDLNAPFATTCDGMFDGCTKLTAVSKLNLPMITSARRMFAECTQLATINELPLENVTDAREMFRGCRHLPTMFPWTINLTGITDVAMLQDMFTDAGAREVTIILKTELVENLDASVISAYGSLRLVHVIDEAGEMTTFDTPMAMNFTNWWPNGAMLGDTSYALATSAEDLRVLEDYIMYGCAGMFKGASALTSIPTLVADPSVTSAAEMFNGCSSLTTIANVDLRGVTNYANVFTGCSSLRTISNVTAYASVDSTSLFGQLRSTSVTSVDVDLPLGDSLANALEGMTTLETMAITSAPSVTTFARAFAGCTGLRSMTFSTPPNGADWSYAFTGDSALTSPPNLGKPVRITGVFSGCTSLPTTFPYTLDLSGVTNAEDLFYAFDDSSVENLTVIGTTSNRGILHAMYLGVKNLTVVNVSGTILSQTTDESAPPSYMHAYVTAGEVVDLKLPKGITRIRVAAVSGCDYRSGTTSASEVPTTLHPSTFVDTVTNEMLVSSIAASPPGARGEGTWFEGTTVYVQGYRPVFGATVNSATTGTYGAGVAGGCTAKSSGKYVQGYKFVGETLVDQTIDVVGGRTYRITVGEGTATGCCQPKSGNYVSGYVLIGWGSSYVSA